MTHTRTNANCACSANTVNMAVSYAAMSAARFIFALRFYFFGFMGLRTSI